MDWSLLLNVLMGGGLVATVAGLLSLRSSLREATAKAEHAAADAESVRLTNTEAATRILMSNIVEPLKRELDATRKEISANKKEMERLLNAHKRELARLRKAIDGANRCDYRDGCPVLERMRDEEDVVVEQPDGAGGDVVVDGGHAPSPDVDTPDE